MVGVTREQKITRARALHEKGASFPEIAEQLGVHKKTVRRWLNPDEAERDRASSRAYKERNRDAMRVYNREYNEFHKGECPQCGGEMDRQTARGGGKCRACVEDNAGRRARQVESWWAEGLSMREIGRRLGWSESSNVGGYLDRLRAQGYALPYRNRAVNRPPHKHPDQVAA